MSRSKIWSQFLCVGVAALLCSSPAELEWSELHQPWFESLDLKQGLAYVRPLRGGAYQKALHWLTQKDDTQARTAFEKLYARLTQLNLKHESNQGVRTKLGYVAWHLAKIAERQTRPAAALDMYRVVIDATPNLRLWALLRMMEIALDVDPGLTDDVLKTFQAHSVMDDFPMQTQWQLYQSVSRAWFDPALDLNKINQAMGYFSNVHGSLSVQNLSEYWRARLIERLMDRLRQDRKSGAQDLDNESVQNKVRTLSLEAMVVYRKLARRVPFHDLGRKAQLQADALYIGLSDADRVRFRKDSVREAAWYAEALVAAQRHSDAAQAYETLAQREDATEEERNEFFLKYCETLGRLKTREKLLTSLTAWMKSWKTAPSLDVQARAHYQLARAYSNLRRNDEAVPEYEWVVAHAPEHRLADDASLRSAIIAKEAGDMPTAFKRLGRIRGGDMSDEAKFLEGFYAYLNNDWDHARRRWEENAPRALSQSVDKEEGTRGRTIYWLAMALNRLGRSAEAHERMRALISRFPLSYYAQRGCERLLQWGAIGTATPPEACETARPLRLEDKVHIRETQSRLSHLAEQPAFARSLDLLRVRAFDEADIELKTLMRRKAYASEYQTSLMRLLAAVEAWPAVIGWGRRWLIGTAWGEQGREVTKQDWLAAYPDPYADVVNAIARQEAIPREFLWAIGREESSFNPVAVSGAGALGVVQLMKATACAQVKELEGNKTKMHAEVLRCDEAALKDPHINLRLGGHLMASLWKRYPSPALVPSAYNAGSGATDRWLVERPLNNTDVDVWIESIPYDESRRYSRRVLQSYGTYAWIQTGRPPTFLRKAM